MKSTLVKTTAEKEAIKELIGKITAIIQAGIQRQNSLAYGLYVGIGLLKI